MSVNITFEAHSTSLDNEAGLSSGWNDVELSPTGKVQAEDLGKRYKNRHFDAVFCSDLRRSYHSASIAFSGREESNIIQDKRLRECNYGDLTQHPSENIEKEKSSRILSPFPGGESYTDTLHRMQDFLNDVRKEYAGKCVLIIGHRATQYGIEHVINGVSLEQLVSEKFRWQPGWEYELL